MDSCHVLSYFTRYGGKLRRGIVVYFLHHLSEIESVGILGNIIKNKQTNNNNSSRIFTYLRTVFCLRFLSPCMKINFNLENFIADLLKIYFTESMTSGNFDYCCSILEFMLQKKKN